MWLGGSFAGGKSTTARVLAESYGLEVYHVDHDIINNPDLESARVADREWFWLPLSEKLERYKKVISHVFERARDLSEADDIIAEGPCLLPQFLDKNKIERSNAAVLVATPEHQRFANTKRRKHCPRDILDDFEDQNKAKAWNEWMAVDDEFASYVSESAIEIGYPVIQNDGALPTKELANRIANIFGLNKDSGLSVREGT